MTSLLLSIRCCLSGCKGVPEWWQTVQPRSWEASTSASYESFREVGGIRLDTGERVAVLHLRLDKCTITDIRFSEERMVFLIVASAFNDEVVLGSITADFCTGKIVVVSAVRTETQFSLSESNVYVVAQNEYKELVVADMKRVDLRSLAEAAGELYR